MRILFFVLVLISSVLVAQEKYEVNENNEVRKVMDNWRELTPPELEACQNPGKQILYGNIEFVYKKVDFWHYRETTIVKKSVMFDAELNKLCYKDGDFVKSDDVKFAWHILFLLISLALAVIFNFIIYNKVKLNAFAFAFAFAIVFAIAFAIASAIAFAFASSDNDQEKQKNIKISQRWLIVDYIVIALYLAIWFIL